MDTESLKVLSQGVWKGDRNALMLLYQHYKANEQTLKLASLLYSFRRLQWCREELALLGEELLPVAAKTANRLENEEANHQLIIKADMLSTILMWLAHNNIAVKKRQTEYLQSAKMLVLLGMQNGVSMPEEHTRALLATTGAALSLDQGKREEALAYLLAALRAAPVIKDKNQRLRVLRRIGAAYWRLYKPLSASWCLGQAAALTVLCKLQPS